MTRIPDWPTALADCVSRAREEPFIWGKNDCALFTCDCIMAITGRDYAEKFRGKYGTEKGAYRAIRKIEGVSSLEELATKYLGDPIPTTYAGRGDVVMTSTPTGPALGIVVNRNAAFRTPSGIEMIPPDRWEKAWRVL